MKKIILIFLSIMTHQLAMAQCDCEELDGVMPSDKTLFSGNCYTMGCYEVPTDKELIIQGGAVIFMNSGGALYVHRGGTITALGTAMAPITFTSGEPAGSRTSGYWQGIVIAGKATNNEPGGQISLDLGCGVEGGGNDDNDNSGVFEHVQLHFSENGLTLLSVGDATTISNVQVTFAANDGFQFYGGTVHAKKLFSYNAHRNDFYFTNGNRSLLQELVGFRQDPTAHVASGSYGAMFENDGSGTSNTPLTEPTITNMEVVGPSFCTGGSLSGDFIDGIDVRRNAAPKIYNTVETNWPNYGLRVTDASTVANTAGDIFNFSYNTLTNNGSGYYTTATSWSSGCFTSMLDWLETTASFPPSCIETGNQFVSIALGYNTGSMCSTTVNPDFTLGSSTPSLDAPDYSAADLAPGFFSQLNTRGAFDATDWTNGSTNFNPQDELYCEDNKMMKSGKQQLQLSPNPAGHATTAYFSLEKAGKVVVTIASVNDGRPVMSLEPMQLNAGVQELHINTSTLDAGVYIVRIVSGGQVLQQHLMIH